MNALISSLHAPSTSASTFSTCPFLCQSCVRTQASSDPEKFVLHPQPLEYNYNEFERLLLGIAWHVYVTKKKGEAFEEVRVQSLNLLCDHIPTICCLSYVICPQPCPV